MATRRVHGIPLATRRFSQVRGFRTERHLSAFRQGGECILPACLPSRTSRQLPLGFLYFVPPPRRSMSGGLTARSTCPALCRSAWFGRAGALLATRRQKRSTRARHSSSAASLTSSGAWSWASPSTTSMNASVSLAPPNATRNWSMTVLCSCSRTASMSVFPWGGRGAVPATRSRPTGGRPRDDNTGSSESSHLCSVLPATSLSDVHPAASVGLRPPDRRQYDHVDSLTLRLRN